MDSHSRTRSRVGACSPSSSAWSVLAGSVAVMSEACYPAINLYNSNVTPSDTRDDALRWTVRVRHPVPDRDVAPRGADRVQRDDARDAARGPRPDDRRDGAAADRHRPARLPGAVVGRELVPRRRDGDRAALRQAVGPLRPAADVPRVDLDLPGRIGTVRSGAVDGPAHRLPRAAGHRRRWPAAARAGGDRRSLLAARPRPLPGLHR